LTVTFLTPRAGLVGLLALVGLWTLLRSERKARSLCRLLGLPPRSPLVSLGRGAAIAAGGVLLGLAAAQPVLARERARQGRTDAEALFVFDISRSMEAQAGPRSPSRFERAKRVALTLRDGLPDVPAGVATMTDRLLPQLFPTLDRAAFAATVEKSVGIEHPPPDRGGRGRATALAALGVLGRQNFFAPGARRRLAIVLTDGETIPVNVFRLRERLDSSGIVPLFIRVWAGDERIFDDQGHAISYRPDPASAARFTDIATAAGGRLVDESDAPAALDFARSTLARGPTGPAGQELHARALAPFLVLAAAIPLLFLVWRRNLAPVPA
jgi:hypothetical protein